MASPAPAPDLTVSMLPAGGVDANALDAAFTLVSIEEEEERRGEFFGSGERGKKRENFFKLTFFSSPSKKKRLKKPFKKNF